MLLLRAGVILPSQSEEEEEEEEEWFLSAGLTHG